MSSPHTNGCEECLKMGDTWVHLRLCLECGHVGCCDVEEQARHEALPLDPAPHHRSFEPGENWKWCYVDEIGWE